MAWPHQRVYGTLVGRSAEATPRKRVNVTYWQRSNSKGAHVKPWLYSHGLPQTMLLLSYSGFHICMYPLVAGATLPKFQRGLTRAWVNFIFSIILAGDSACGHAFRYEIVNFVVTANFYSPLCNLGTLQNYTLWVKNPIVQKNTSSDSVEWIQCYRFIVGI